MSVDESWNPASLLHDRLLHFFIFLLETKAMNFKTSFVRRLARRKKKNEAASTPLHRSSSQVGLEEYIESRKVEGSFITKMVNIEIPLGKLIEDVYDGVHTGEILGIGASGVVRRVTHRATGHEYAVKCLDLSRINSVQGLRQLREEISIMCELDHPNCIRLEEVYESSSEIYLVQELCQGGDLFDRLGQQPDDFFTETECARLVKQMLSAIHYLHSKHVVHRDLKLENFLLTSESQSDLVLIDFGLSKHFEYGEIHHEATGTRYTVAPEVIRGSYDERCDVWGIGVLAFLLLSGDPPFGGMDECDSLTKIRSNILSGTFAYEREEVWSVVSTQAKSFVEALLVTDPERRATVEQALQHPWLRERTQRVSRLIPDVVHAFAFFKDMNDLQRLFFEIVSFTLSPEQLTELRKEFEKVDMDGTGEISLTALREALMTNVTTESIQSLTGEQVEDIFNAMRVRKSETCVNWHEFVAAGLSLCQVDDGNLRLAFDRLDSDHKQCVTFENITDLIGNDISESETSMRTMWSESLRLFSCQRGISYSEFSLIIRGQLHEMGQSKLPDASRPSTTLPRLDEVEIEDGSDESTDILYSPKVDYSRPRSRSAGDAETSQEEIVEYSYAPLAINREVFHACHQMRLAVIEASNRFNDHIGQSAAGLVLRHGARSRVASDAARAWLDKTQKEQEEFVRRARKQAGSGT